MNATIDAAALPLPYLFVRPRFRVKRQPSRSGAISEEVLF